MRDSGLIGGESDGSLGTDQELDSMKNLEIFSFLLAGLALPITSRLARIEDFRSGGSDFDSNISMPSEYSSLYGAFVPPVNTGNALQAYTGGHIQRMAEGGYIGGIAGGMDDTVPATVDGSQPAALSAGEFVVPADVVSHLGDGNNQNGASKLYGFLDQVRSVKTGSTEQPAPFNDGIMSGIIGDEYGR